MTLTMSAKAEPVRATAAEPPDNRLAQLAGTRDPRLDFFRGIAMYIILVAHTPNNYWALWIPARFGWSDATEIFVFCSGMASAIAFGRVFARHGIGMGALRVAHRIWQVYWAHIGLFLAVVATMYAVASTGRLETDYVDLLNLHRFLSGNTGQNLLGLMTLTYVPNYFDVLPMYIVALALMPVVVAAQRVHTLAAVALVLILWLGAQVQILELPAEPWSDRVWFFNPFGWQLIFFSGFAFMAGWLPKPPVTRGLIRASVAMLVVTAALAFNWGQHLPDTRAGLGAAESWQVRLHEATMAVRASLNPLIVKTDFGVLRYLHFLALAYLAWVAVGPRGANLAPRGRGIGARIWDRLLPAILKVGQQSLAVFVFSMWYAQVQGIFLDIIGRNWATVALVNLSGLAMITALAYFAGWIKSHPWRSRPATG